MAAVKWTDFFCCAEVQTKQYKLIQFAFQFPDWILQCTNYFFTLGYIQALINIFIYEEITDSS